jgi:hypothetical protein
MSKLRPFVLAFVLTVAACASASAETLRCRSVNGNTTCSGSGAVSCQTVNGRTVCVGGNGAAVQSFGADAPTREEMQELNRLDRDDLDDDAPPPPAKRRLSVKRWDANGPVLSLEQSAGEQSAGRLRLHTRRTDVTIDR